MPWWKHLYCVLGKCTECGDSAGQCLTWLIWNGLCVSGDLAGAPSALCRSIFFFFFFNILCLVQSALFQGKVLVLQSHFLTAPWAGVAAQGLGERWPEAWLQLPQTCCLLLRECNFLSDHVCTHLTALHEVANIYHFPEKMHCRQVWLSKRRKHPKPGAPGCIPALWYTAAGKLQAWSRQRVEVTRGNPSAQSRAQSKEKLFGQCALAQGSWHQHSYADLYTAAIGALNVHIY